MYMLSLRAAVQLSGAALLASFAAIKMTQRVCSRQHLGHEYVIV